MNGKEMTGSKITGRLDALREEGWTVERRSGRLNGRKIIWKAKAKVVRKEDRKVVGLLPSFFLRGQKSNLKQKNIC